MGECIILRHEGLAPKGSIALWSGAVDTIPDGWVLCDGANGTPDLRGRFVVGAGGAYAVNAKGGAETVALTTAQMPSHTHQANLNTGGAGSHDHYINRSVQLDPPDDSNRGEEVGTYQHWDFTGTTSTAGEHSHTITGSIAATGNGLAHENRPPYYALCYIMKL